MVLTEAGQIIPRRAGVCCLFIERKRQCSGPEVKDRDVSTHRRQSISACSLRVSVKPLEYPAVPVRSGKDEMYS